MLSDFESSKKLIFCILRNVTFLLPSTHHSSLCRASQHTGTQDRFVQAQKPGAKQIFHGRKDKGMMQLVSEEGNFSIWSAKNNAYLLGGWVDCHRAGLFLKVQIDIKRHSVSYSIWICIIWFQTFQNKLHL